jgi:2-oxoglutarate ferredoxin oxidoreductase subunit beta
MSSELITKYFREERLPHIWCPGCGHGIATRAVMEAVDRLGWEKDDVCIVSGIGCSSRAPGYLDFNTLHTTHGRALAFATGIKLAKPHLHVIVLTGDGDTSAIGGNHLIHAARRNIDITTVVYNNYIYGMTGGQYSPTTPFHDKGTTAPYGNIDQPFDICSLAQAAGATYVARSTVFHAKQLSQLVEKALQKKGFSLVEAISSCPTYYGRKNKKGSAVDMMNFLKFRAVPSNRFAALSEEEKLEHVETGVFINRTAPEYTESYQKIIDLVQEREESK